MADQGGALPASPANNLDLQAQQAQVAAINLLVQAITDLVPTVVASIPQYGASAAISTTASTAVFTATATTYVTLIRVAASTGSAGTATIAWYRAASGATIEQVYQRPVLSNYPAEIKGSLLSPVLVMAASDEIRITGASGQDVTVNYGLPPS